MESVFPDDEPDFEPAEDSDKENIPPESLGRVVKKPEKKPDDGTTSGSSRSEYEDSDSDDYDELIADLSGSEADRPSSSREEEKISKTEGPAITVAGNGSNGHGKRRATRRKGKAIGVQKLTTRVVKLQKAANSLRATCARLSKVKKRTVKKRPAAKKSSKKKAIRKKGGRKGGKRR